VNLPDSLFAIFLAGFSSQCVLNKDLTVWLDGARPANTCIPPSFLGNVSAQPHGAPYPKNTFASIKKLAKFGEITFLQENKNH
jgi:hypothetical protein